MFEAGSKSLPPLDYVSMIRSLYADRRSQMLGALGSAVAVALTWMESRDIVLLLIAFGFVIVGVSRHFDMLAFERAKLAEDDVAGAARWEIRATIGGGAIALLYGSWTCYSFLVVNSPFAELASLGVTMSVLVGVAARNFAVERVMMIQVMLICIPTWIGMLFDGHFHTALLSFIFLPFFASLRNVAGNVRVILLKAVHGRVEASRLAAELDTALETMQHGICMLDAGGLIAVSNDQAEAVFRGLVPGSWEGRPFAALIASAAARGAVAQAAAHQLTAIVNERGNGKVLLHLPGDQYCEVTVSSRQERTVLLFEDITARIRAEERINFMAHYDALTGLPNRGYFTEQVEADLQRRRETGAAGQAVLMIMDVDDFKHVNDTMGHLVGDRVLVEASERLTRALGADSLVARLGGDEYVVYRSSYGDPDDDTVEGPAAILEAFQTPFQVMGEVFSINVSVGVVVSDSAEDDLDALMTKADLALYKAKANGKNQTQTFHDEMDTDYRYRQRLKGDLKLAVTAGNLKLVYQPIVDLTTRRVVSCEALARWQHPELGAIPPSLFIPLAEETGLISEISRWVLATATAECRNWPEEVSVSVNISARDFRNADVEAMVGDALGNSRLAPERLEVEVTETALIEEKAAATAILSSLASKGVGIALDDFGTGYSSLSYLHALPFSKLKIDRSFVMDIGSNPRSLKLLSNVAQLGKDINLTVTAEGVETEEQLMLIQQHTKVDQVQGYLFGVPLSKRDVSELINRMIVASEEPQRNRKRG